METNVFLIVSIVLGVLLLGSIIAVICVAVIPSSCENKKEDDRPHVYFDNFTAETVTIYSPATFYGKGGLGDNLHHHGSTMQYVFSPGKWYMESLNETGHVTSREIYTDGGSKNIRCLHLITHDNCFVLPSNPESSSGVFSIPHEALYLGEDNCLWPWSFKDFIPDRKLNKCKSYSLSDDTTAIFFSVDSETGYPIMTKIMKYPFEQAGNIMIVQLYKSFKAEKPTDESGLQPFPGVKLYDFRPSNDTTDKGDRTLATSSVLKKPQEYPRKINDAKVLFESLKENKDENADETHKYIQSIRRKKALHDFLHLPSPGLSASPSISVSETPSIRDIRDIPTSFDAREHWQSCSDVIGTITNQMTCGSCWAMAGSGVFADRICIANDTNKEQLSPQYMVDCVMLADGCDGGGETLPVLEGMKKYGTVPEWCVPFVGRDEVCPTRCVTGENITDDIIVRTGAKVALPWGDGDLARVQAIQTEIMTNGPVVSGFVVFNDFEDFFYKNPKGIYERSKTALPRGGHAVRIIGWGTEGGVDYWLVANSWGKTFADNGIFKIRRGTNECNFEEQVSAGFPA